MPVRGSRSIWPSAKSKPTGIFSTRGSQKNDSTSEFDHKGLMAYAHKHDRKRGKPGPDRPAPKTDKKRHQAPKKGY